MIDYTLEEDLPEEFRGGTLRIHSENKLNDLIKSSESPTASADNIDNSSLTNNNKSNNNNWGSSFASPLNKITVCLWNKKPNSNDKQIENTTMQQKICIAEDPNNFFTFRDGVVEKAVNDCKEQFLNLETDGPLIASFLLTQINHWNSDKERLILVTTKTLVVIKYDFIALKRLEYKKMSLDSIDEVLIGDLIYPNGSLIPRMNGFVDGLSNVLENCLFAKWSKSDNKQFGSFYQPSNRNTHGIRLIWNKGKALNFGSQWNPFNDDMPFLTLTYHPLYFHKDCSGDKSIRNLFNLDLFIETICSAISDLQSEKNQNSCVILNDNIILQNYIGLGSVIHNRNSLGFFKVRGKFSF